MMIASVLFNMKSVQLEPKGYFEITDDASQSRFRVQNDTDEWRCFDLDDNGILTALRDTLGEAYLTTVHGLLR